MQDDRDRATPDDVQPQPPADAPRDAGEPDERGAPGEQIGSAEPTSDETAAEFETVPAATHPSADAAQEPEVPEAEPQVAEATESEPHDAEAQEPVEPRATQGFEAGQSSEPMVASAESTTAAPPPPEAEAYAAPPAEPAAAQAEAAHTVPATDVGESTQCPRCGTENRPGVAFCRNCGQRLVAAGVSTTVERPSAPEGTQQCPRCGTHNRAGVAFCQNCGANLRAAAAPVPGYVPPSAQQVSRAEAGMPPPQPARGGAVLGPLVLLVGAIGLATAWFLPFPYGSGSLWDRSFGTSGGYGVAFWSGYPNVNGGMLDAAYFGFAAAAPILLGILVLLILAGFLRAAPGGLQLLGLLVALLWALGLSATFIALEVVGNWNGDLVGMLRNISPSGIIFLLSSLIVLIGTVTRLARS